MLGTTNLFIFVYKVMSLIIGFTIHEFSHAYVATKFGDPTPRIQGKLNLNPRNHIDIFGFFLILFLGFGWAKPVYVNYSFLKIPRLAGPLISLAGPLSNLLLATLGMIMLYYNNIYLNLNIGDLLAIFINFNVILFVFNLIPLPPLDGYNILKSFLPNSQNQFLLEFERNRYLTIILIIIFGGAIIQPLVINVVKWLSMFVNLIFI